MGSCVRCHRKIIYTQHIFGDHIIRICIAFAALPSPGGRNGDHTVPIGLLMTSSDIFLSSEKRQ